MIKNEDLIGRVSKILLCTSFRNHVTKEHLIEVVEYFQTTFYESRFLCKGHKHENDEWYDAYSSSNEKCGASKPGKDGVEKQLKIT